MPVANSTVVVDVSHVSAFDVDSLGITAYHDGYNDFAPSGRSLFARVEYDLLYCGTARDAKDGPLAHVLRRFEVGR